MIPQRFLTPFWNDVLVLGLGLPALAFVGYAAVSGIWSELAGLIGMGVIGGFY